MSLSATTLVPFGPTREIPPGHRWCMSCDGDGVDSLTGHGPCGVCRGKGCWNAEDIADYHGRHPAVCELSCGPRHVEPAFGRLLKPGEVDEALREARALLEAPVVPNGKRP